MNNRLLFGLLVATNEPFRSLRGKAAKFYFYFFWLSVHLEGIKNEANTAFVSETEEQFKGERFGPKAAAAFQKCPAPNAEARKDSHVN